MKNLLLLTLFISNPLMAKPIVMLSFYDAFGSNEVNNSEIVARELALRINTPASPVEIKLCALNTVFDKAYAQTEECLKNLPEAPVMVIGLGETGCDVKVETMMRNRDKTFGPDNEGNERINTEVVASAPKVIALKYPLPQMYCALSKVEKKEMIISNFAGTFVCNNTAYQVAHYYPELTFGFIHVPTYNCRNFKTKTDKGIIALEKMLLAGPSVKDGSPAGTKRLPLTKEELRKLTDQYQRTDPCLYDFYKRSKPADDLRRREEN